MKQKLVAKGFGLGISDMEVGPGGDLYIVAYGQGAIYRIFQAAK